MSIGSLLKKVRTMRHLTQKQLASGVNVTESAIRNYELGIRQPNEEQLDLIAQVLNVSPVLFQFEQTGSMDLMALCMIRYGDDFSIDVDDSKPPILRISGISDEAKRLLDIIAEWKHKNTDLDKGLISEDKYEQWILEALSTNR